MEENLQNTTIWEPDLDAGNSPVSATLLSTLLAVLRRQDDPATVEELMSMVPLSYSLEDADRAILHSVMRETARKMRVSADFEQVVKAHDAIFARTRQKNETLLHGVPLATTASGKIKQTLDNYKQVFDHDPHYRGWAQDLLLDSPVIPKGEGFRRFTDDDRVASLRLCEEKYGLSTDVRHDQALRLYLSEHKFHPIYEYVDTLVWDGKPRITGFLTKWMGAEDSPYTREVSRIIFAGGMHRLQCPGCKFDEMPVLIGTRQGEGKSTLVRLLAMRDEWYRELTDMEGQTAIEQLTGGWVVEVSELLALSRARELEGVKAFLSRQHDRYRRPYDRFVTEIPRGCIFIGTTNDASFLRDKTGNRRFYPVQVKTTAAELFAREDELREDIRQCWAEARELFDRGELPPFADPALFDTIRQHQTSAMEDDWRRGLIERYLAAKPVGDTVCVRELLDEVLYPNTPNRAYDPKESRQIGQILNGVEGYERIGLSYTTRYGMQRSWRRVLGSTMRGHKIGKSSN